MRNLVSLARRWTPLDGPASSDGAPPKCKRRCVCCAFAVDAGARRAFFLRGGGRIVGVDLDDRESPYELIDLRVALITTVEDSDQCWKWMSYVAELDALVCASTDGALVVVNVEDRMSEELGALDGGICALAWSSDQEKLAIATGVGTLVVMNQRWVVLHEVQWDSLLPTELRRAPGANECTLCWRDDAQYLTMNVAVVESKTEKIQQKVLVFTHELELHAVGRLEDGRPITALGCALDWRPDQSLIASSETRQDRLFVVFFERNGLRHGEFELPRAYSSSVFSISRVEWNIDSDILAVELRNNVDGQTVLQLWTRGNYHWYLKQERRCSALVGFAWDDEIAGKLYCLSGIQDELSLDEEEFTWDVVRAECRVAMASRGEQTPAEPQTQSVAIVGVIDGARLLLTPLHQALIPPPMALHEVELAAPINAVKFDVASKSLLCVLSTGTLTIVRNCLTKPEVGPSFVFPNDEDGQAEVLTSLLWFRQDQEGRLVFAAKSGWEDLLVVYSGRINPDGVLAASRTRPDLLRVRRVCDIVYVADCESLKGSRPDFAFQSQDGHVYTITMADTDTAIPHLISQETLVFSHCAVVSLPQDNQLIVGLQQRQSRLYVGERVLVAGCSSFRVSPESGILLCTTIGSQAELRMFPLASLVAVSPDQEVETRKIEQGATLVAVIGDRANVVVQMPRGNLECVTPRLLVLGLVIQLVRQFAFPAALEMCRKHRLDMNLLVDYDREAFLNKLDVNLLRPMLASKPSRIVSDRLSLFVTNLHPLNVWRGKYALQFRDFDPQAASAPSVDQAPSKDQESDKVNVVCEALMTSIAQLELEHDQDGAVLLPFLTCAVKQTPPKIAEALRKIQAISTDSDIGQQRRRQGLKHLALLTDTDKLVDEALGLYDLALVRLVASLSDRDPREYTPFLDELANIADLNERKFRIDLHLERFDRALTHVAALITSPDGNNRRQELEERVVSLVRQGALYDEGLMLFTDSAPDLRRQITWLKAQHLEEEKHFNDAAYVYLSIAALPEAQKAFAAARDWRMAMSISSMLKQTRDQKQKLAYQIVEDLLAHQESVAEVLDAAQIYAEYCDDVDEAVALLVTHKKWTEAHRVALLRQRPDLVESDVEPGVLQSYDDLIEELDDKQRKYVKNWRRLDTILTQKRLFQLHGIDGRRWHGGIGGGEDDSESLVSGATSAAESALSNASMSSVGSHNSALRIGNFAMQSLAQATASHFYATQSLQPSDAGSSQTKRKTKDGLPSRRERRNRMKEGSAEEEKYVTKQLAELQPSDELRVEVRALLEMLILFGHVPRAQKLQSTLSDFEHVVAVDHPPQGINDTALDQTSTLVSWKLAALPQMRHQH